MKRSNFLVVLLVLAFLIGSAGLMLAADTATATDTVAVSYSDTGSVLLLDIELGGEVSLSTTSSYGAVEAGAQPTEGGSLTHSADGGWLQYTLYGQSVSKVTAYISASSGASGTYAAGSLKIKVADSTQTGSYTAGTSATAGYLGTAAAAVSGQFAELTSAAGTAITLIENINGANTWTGARVSGVESAETTDGARLSYQLNGNPGVTSITVTYTITAM